MKIVDYFALPEGEQARARAAIGAGDWRAAKFLCELLEKGELRARCGETTRLLLGMEGEALAAFCTLAEHDEVDAPLMPWIGFVYTCPAFRGQRRSGELIDHACALARAEGFDTLYVSTNEIGLYEKYGFIFLRTMRDEWGGDTRVYRRML